MDVRRFLNKAQGAFRLSDRAIEVSEIEGRALTPQVLDEQHIVHDHQILVSSGQQNPLLPRDGTQLQQRLQLSAESKSIYGEVELKVSGRDEGSEMARWPSVTFNGCHGMELDIQRGHPLYKEFKYFYGGNEAHRAKYLELLADCNDRNVRLIFPGLLQYVPYSSTSLHENQHGEKLKPLIGKCDVYVNLPSVTELLSYLRSRGF